MFIWKLGAVTLVTLPRSLVKSTIYYISFNPFGLALGRIGSEVQSPYIKTLLHGRISHGRRTNTTDLASRRAQDTAQRARAMKT
jgi:hypothetical protein